MPKEKPVIFECSRLFQVEESTPAAGGERPIQTFDSQSSSIAIELSCFRETSAHSALVLVCNNGYLVIHVTPAHGQPVVKQLKWFESRQQHILDVVLDPEGEWLACACLNGAIYLVPVLALMLDCAPSRSFGVLDDITVIQPSRKRASPTCALWWETMDDKHICITGSEVGEITFFDLSDSQDVATVYVSGCIDSLLIAHHTDTATHLLIGLRGGEWKRMLIEEHYHETAGTSYSDAHASGFEVVPDDIVIKSFLNKGEATEEFELKAFPSFSELIHLSTHDWKDQHFLGALNLQNHKYEVYCYDFELFSAPLRTYQLVSGATDTLLTDRLIFVISHDDEHSPCAFTLSVMSSQRATVNEMDDQVPHDSAILQQFTIPSLSNLVGCYSTARESPDLSNGSHDSLVKPTQLGGCVIVTTTAVYQCRQRLSPEGVFMKMALSPQLQERAEEFGITFKLDVCGLYKIAAEKKLNDKKYGQALKLFELSRCLASHIIESFAKHERIPELVHYLHQAVYDDTGHTNMANPKMVQNVLLQCFIHQCLYLHNKSEGVIMTDRFSQFITDKFLYDHSIAMEKLVKCGLKEPLFELAKAHHKLPEVFELLVQEGSLELDVSLQSSLVSRQYVEPLSHAADGLFLYQLMPSTFVRLLTTMPSIIPPHLPHIHSLLPSLDVSSLLRLAHLLDPSHPSIRPLLIRAHSRRNRSSSTGSLASTMSTETNSAFSQEDSSPQLEAYIELFITVIVVLNHRRRQKPASRINSLLSLSFSPLRTSTDHNKGASPIVHLEGSQWLHGSATVSCGLHHAALVMDGNLFTWGSTKNGKLGHGDIEEASKAMPLRVETMTMLSLHVVSVSCGAEHTLAMCQEGIFSWGSSLHGQLGHGDTLKRTRPVQVASLADKGIVSVVCGQYHSMAMDDDHRHFDKLFFAWTVTADVMRETFSVWSWGWGVHGQLGLQSVDDKLLPCHASLLEGKQVSFIVAGYGHSAVLTAEGKVLTFGNGMYGQLGHGNTEKQSVPREVEALADKAVYLLACGNFHTIAVTTDQSVYFWGKNLHRPRPGASLQGLREYKRSRHGQASSAAISNALLPQSITDLELDDTVVQVSCGSFHSLLLTASGSVYSWGSNMNGQLGHCHTAEMAVPKKLACFDDQKIATIATGDEFSIAVDERGTPWAWGKSDNGQLGINMRALAGAGEVPKQSLFAPTVITTLKPTPKSPKKSRETTPESDELPVLELDLGWQLPDFAAIGSPHAPYGRESLNTALRHLHGFYRDSMVLWQCQNWQDWQSMATLHNIEKQWVQALECSLNAFRTNSSEGSSISTTVDGYIEKFISDVKDYHSTGFVKKGLYLLQSLLASWDEHGLEFSQLEAVLAKYLSQLAYPLSLILRSPQTLRLSSGFSFSFQLNVAKEVTDHISTGAPKPEEVLTSTQPEPSETDTSKQVTNETSVGDARLWAEILRNLSKDLSKQSLVQISGAALTNIENSQTESVMEEDMNTSLQKVVAFTCGHAFSLSQLHLKILLDFVERVQDFPISLPHTLKHLQLHYKQSSLYPSACPYCVFQYLRKLQLLESPGVPIRPWNP